jgi:hypothetical protein
MPFGEDLPRDIRTRRDRRGPRMNSRVPVIIEWNGKVGPVHLAPAFTRVVNAYGCLLVSPKEMELQTRLRVTNMATKRAVDGHVVWKGIKRPDGWDLGVELISADQHFWGVEL